MKNSRARIGVIGVGRMGREHARCYASLETAELVAVADIDRSRMTATACRFDCRGYLNYRDMLADEQLDAVSQRSA